MLDSKNTATPDGKNSFAHGDVGLVNLTGFTAKGSHGHDLTREQALAGLGVGQPQPEAG